MIIIARKYKVVKEKKITFDIPQWEKVQERADACNMQTTAFIRDRAVNSDLYVMDLKEMGRMLKDHSHKEVFKKAILSDTDKYKRINSCIINHKIAKPYAITTLLSIPLQINYIS